MINLEGDSLKFKSMKNTFIALIIITVLCGQLFAQECKVLLPAIAGVYEGECDKSKANGKGKSKGTDSYEGQFKNGLPEGIGKYTWQNGNWYEGAFKAGKRQGEGTMHYIGSSKGDSSLTGFWAKDLYVGIYEVPFKVQGKGYNVQTISVKPDTKQSPLQIVIDLSSVMGGSDDTHGTIPKPVLGSIQVLKGSFMTRSDVTNMTKRNMYYLTDVIFPFSASFRISDEDIVIDFNNPNCYRVEIVMRQ